MSSKQNKKRENEKEYTFKAPKFDEKEFMETEIRDSLASLIIFAYAIALAVACFLIQLASSNFGVPFLVGLAAIYGLRPMLKATKKFDISKFERKNWLMYGIIYLFTWLAFWTIFINVV